MKVGLVYGAFFLAFKNYFPEIEVINAKKAMEKTYDLIIFSGGEDISPDFYGAPNIHCYGINPERDEMERDVFYIARDQKTPKLLGVCRGHQLINAMQGSNVIQDLEKETGRHEGEHPLEIIKEFSIVGQAFDKRIVNSLHHQGVRHSGSGLTTTSVYKGIIESSESDKIITVQFHPEMMHDEQANKFFEYIIRWVKEPKKLKSEFEKLRKEKEVNGFTEAKEKFIKNMEYATRTFTTYATNPNFVSVDENGRVIRIVDETDRGENNG